MTQTNNEREAFEAWYLSIYDGRDPIFKIEYSDGPYEYSDIEYAWKAWRARARLAISQNEQKEHCCPECGCHFVGEFPFEYHTKQAIPDGGYQAATKASEKRIRDLEYLIDLDTELHENSAKTILELQAHVNQLLEALESAWSYTHTNEKLMNSITSLLYSTPAQSLAERKEEYKCKLMSECTDPNL